MPTVKSFLSSKSKDKVSSKVWVRPNKEKRVYTQEQILNLIIGSIKQNKLQKLNIVFDLDNTLIYSIERSKLNEESIEYLNGLCQIGLAGVLNFVERFERK